MYYAEGGIVDEASAHRSVRANEIVGSKVVRDLDALANDEAVKAVVLVSIQGWQCVCFRTMWRAIQLLKKKSP
ncbi:MAG: hypothetical protein ACLS29_04040 [Prevotellamassilia sp.]